MNIKKCGLNESVVKKEEEKNKNLEKNLEEIEK